ncbi:MAG TPA: hypothetical protein DCF33_22065 [Saprospirales bacterium]|nr:hypothetical protein [Saprospirales bacterium]
MSKLEFKTSTDALKCLIALVFFSGNSWFLSAQVGINTDGATPHPSAMLEVKSSNKGILIPRMSSQQRLSIPAPANGLMVYDTDSSSLAVFVTSAWAFIRPYPPYPPTPAEPHRIVDTDHDTWVDVEKTTDDDIIRFAIKGGEYMVLRKNASDHPILELIDTGTNTFVGEHAGDSTANGSANTALGFQALRNNTDGIANTAAGTGALSTNTLGNGNAAFGAGALFNNKTGNQNSAVGRNAMYGNTTGTANVAVGVEALAANTDGDNNIGIGFQSLTNNKTGFGNSAVGKEALRDNLDGNNNIAHGGAALLYNVNGSNNTAIGVGTLVANNASNNCAVGAFSMENNTTGVWNTSLGTSSFQENTTGSYNTAIGIGALNKSVSGNYNTGIGVGALNNNVKGSYNTALGYNADVSNDSLFNATAIGTNSFVGSSSSMVLGGLGVYAVKVGIGLTTPTHYLTVKSPNTETMRLIGPTGVNGYGARLHFGDADFAYIDEPTDNQLRIQANLVGIGRIPGTNALEVEGNASKSTAGPFVANSDARLKKNIEPLDPETTLEKMLALRGVTYEWNDDKTGSKRPEGIQYGFTAQNIQDVFPTLVEEDSKGYLQTAYSTYDAMMVESLRALNQKIKDLQAENDALKAQQVQIQNANAQLRQQLEAVQTLESRIQALEKQQR